MRTTFFFILLVYYVYNHMFLHFFKTYKMYEIHKPLPVSGFHRPIIRSYQNMWSCELYINPSSATLNIVSVLVRVLLHLYSVSFILR
jgi:hypothetical protein